jgi:hypothetical protein
MITMQGYLRTEREGRRELVGSMTHVCDDERYAHLNDVVCAVAGEVGAGGVVVEVAQLVWEPLETS